MNKIALTLHSYVPDVLLHLFNIHGSLIQKQVDATLETLSILRKSHFYEMRVLGQLGDLREM